MTSVDDLDRAYAEAVGANLRAARNRRGLTLGQIEDRTGGHLRIADVAAYERGEQAASVQRLEELAFLYRVPFESLLPGPGSPRHLPIPLPAVRPTVVVDLQRLRARRDWCSRAATRCIAGIQELRGDDGGTSIALREDDLDVLAVIHNITVGDLIDAWRAAGIIA
jgi:transcriptional regulator with XRE-family HTH domain